MWGLSFLIQKIRSYSATLYLNKILQCLHNLIQFCVRIRHFCLQKINFEFSECYLKNIIVLEILGFFCERIISNSSRRIFFLLDKPHTIYYNKAKFCTKDSGSLFAKFKLDIHFEFLYKEILFESCEKYF